MHIPEYPFLFLPWSTNVLTGAPEHWSTNVLTKALVFLTGVLVKMKITFPHMGHVGIVVKTILTKLGQEVIVPPPTSRRTLNLGTRHAPEFACLPFKVNLGNFIESLEKGADTLLMVGDSGNGSCRLGFYARIQQIILKELGYNFRMITLTNRSGGEFMGGLADLGRGKSRKEIASAFWLGWRKMRLCEEAERWSHRIRPCEINRGETTRVYQRTIKMIDESEDISQLRGGRKENLALFRKIEQDRQRRPLRIAVTGEIYVVWEPFVNLNIETKLGEMGVEVMRCLWLSENILHRVHLDFWNWRSKSRALKAAEPYLGYNVGAECNISVGNTVIAKQRGYDGLIHLMPFTCMPEIVAQNILPKVSRHHDMPVLTFILDEHTGEAGMATRLEAFVDLLARRREKIRKN